MVVNLIGGGHAVQEFNKIDHIEKDHYHRAYIYRGPCVFQSFYYLASDTKFERNHFAFYKEMNQCNVKPDYIVYLYVLTVMNKL